MRSAEEDGRASGREGGRGRESEDSLDCERARERGKQTGREGGREPDEVRNTEKQRGGKGTRREKRTKPPPPLSAL